MSQDYIYTKLFNTIAMPGKEMHRPPAIVAEDGTITPQKKVVDNKPLALPLWKDKSNQNYTPSATSVAPILAAVVSNDQVFIDFDVAKWYEDARALDTRQEQPCRYIAESDKPTADGHFGYRIHPDLVYSTLELERSEALTEGHYKKAMSKLFGGFGIVGKIDIQYGGGKLIFLASSGNKTKTLVTPPLTEGEHLSYLPDDMLHYVQALLFQHGAKTTQVIDYKPDEGGLYGALTEAFVSQVTRDAEFFRATTPYKWRDHLDDTLHPSTLDEKPHQYLFAYATKLGRDASVDATTFEGAIKKLNSLCNPPKNYSDLEAQIIQPILSGASRINNTPIWQYNPDWRGHTIGFTDVITNDAYAIYHNKTSAKDPYLFINLTKEDMLRRSKNPAQHLWQSLAGLSKEPNVGRAKPITLIHTPSQEFGVTNAVEGIVYNSFKRSIGSMVASDTSVHNKYEPVDRFIEYVHTFFSSEAKAEYVLRFILTKMLNYVHSPVVIMLDGRARSGKGIFTAVLSNLMGALDDADIKVTLNEDLVGDKFNSYLVKAEVVLIDEFASFEPKNQKKCTGMVKTISGAIGGKFTMREMQAASKVAETRVTFVFNSNEAVRLFDETGQSRLFYNLSREKFFDNFTHDEANYWSTSKEFTIRLAAHLARDYEPLPLTEFMDVPEWVYEDDPDIIAYMNANIKPEKAIEEAFYSKDATGLMAALGVSKWSDVPHVSVENKNYRSKETTYTSRVILQTIGQTGADNYSSSLQELLGSRLNWPKILGNLQRQPADIKPKRIANAWTVEFNKVPEVANGQAINLKD